MNKTFGLHSLYTNYLPLWVIESASFTHPIWDFQHAHGLITPPPPDMPRYLGSAVQFNAETPYRGKSVGRQVTNTIAALAPLLNGWTEFHRCMKSAHEDSSKTGVDGAVVTVELLLQTSDSVPCHAATDGTLP